ncbi:hypothetical protein P9Z80_14440 [Bacillus cereus]|nr:hypothetical protein [Bacillus cereus]MEC3258999.1 hypothetical protein [Bacillus cereus]
MSKIDSLLKRARKLQADRIPTSKVHIVSDSEQIEEIPPEKKARENIYIVGSIGEECDSCHKHYRKCECYAGNDGTVTKVMYEYWKETSPKHYERLMMIREQEEKRDK